MIMGIRLMLLIAMIAQNEYAQSANPVSIALEKQTLSSGEPVLMQVHVKNTASVPLEIDLGLNGKDNILIVVTQPDGKRIEKPQPVPRNGLAFFGWQHLESGQEYSETLVLNEWFEFRQVGRYQIEIRLKEPATIGTEKISVGPVVLILDVTPQNIEQLTTACKNLVARVRHFQVAQDSIAALAALDYVNEPALFPFWAQQAQSGDLDLRKMAFTNLARIGSMDAVEVLSRTIRSQDKDTRMMARSALEYVARVASDEAIKTRAEKALSQR
jgi:hypothetical protein